MISTETPGPRTFSFARDTFSFANELIWQYRWDPDTGALTTLRSEPPPTYSHRCFVMVRSARQFLYHAQFEPRAPALASSEYLRLVREVVGRNPRRPSHDRDRIPIPGYPGLRAFSAAHEPVLKAGCGKAWESYFVRSHWRMVYPVPRRHQERMSRQLVQALRLRWAPIVHLFRFPQLTINHGVVLFGVAETATGLQFDVYDPNMPQTPLQLEYQRATRTFTFQPTSYWIGGALNVYEMYVGGLY